ncbi:unnamed protein product [Mytilus coruscus]|uniref:Uncharacterized protein n=1 Tax=Mytilus coruscus TaxID=42192 RepID=A0A6J8EJA9_MYTCO|nr:unnamed protein product [Mytilus coruscus]
MLTGVCYRIRICRKRQSIKLRVINEDVILEPLEPSPYIGIYDEVDENPLTFDITGLTVTSQESHYITIDPGSQEQLSLITSTEHGDTENLDLHVAMEEGEHPQLPNRSSQKECISSNSFNSDVVNPDTTAYHNLYQLIQENWQDDSHGYEVPVVVHKCFESSLGFDENARINSYYNVYHACQKDCDMKSPAYENQKSLETNAGND